MPWIMRISDLGTTELSVEQANAFGNAILGVKVRMNPLLG